MFGQDKVIFKQFLLNKKCWYNKEGQFKCRPKDDGSGIMCSEYQSREYGFGFSEFQKWKQAVNTYRKGNSYHVATAALEVRKTSKKGDLEEYPFVRLFQYGNSKGKEGY